VLLQILRQLEDDKEDRKFKTEIASAAAAGAPATQAGSTTRDGQLPPTTHS